MEEQEKNLEGFIEGSYNIKIKPEYVGKDLVKQQLEEKGFKIKMKIETICTYNVQFDIPKEIGESEKLDYVKEKLKPLDYIVSVEKSVEIKALDNNKNSYNGSNPV